MLKSKRILAIILALALLVVSTVVSMATQSDDTAATLKAAFAAYVKKTGNNIVYSDVVSGVAEELEALGSNLTANDISLAEGDFYIKHAVDGVIDEDPDPTTRINIPGSDGAAAAIFTVGGARYAMVEVIPHSVENLGLLTHAKLDDNGSEIYNATVQGTGNNKIVITDGLMLNNYFYVYGDPSKIVAIVSKDHAEDVSVVALDKVYREQTLDQTALSNVKVLQFSDDIKSFSAAWAYNSRLPGVKYMHLPVNVASIQYGCLYGFTALENVNIPMDFLSDDYYPDHFLKSCPNLLEIYAPVEKLGTNNSFIDGNPNRNFVVAGAEMTFAQAAAYAASNASTYDWVDDYTEETLTTAILDKVVHTGLTTAWNDTLSFDKSTYTLSGTLTLTSGEDSFDIPLSVVNDNVNYNVEDIKTAFKAYVKENGNSITYANVVTGVAAKLKEMGSSYVAADLGLAQSDFYIKHAVDGVIDEDPDPTTRINIPGSDGAVAATFAVDGQRLSMVEVIPHEVENLGLLTHAKLDNNGTTIQAATTQGTGNNKIVITDGLMLNNYFYVYGDPSKIVAIVSKDHAEDVSVVALDKVYREQTLDQTALSNVKVLQFSDDITSFSVAWAYNSRLPGVKYMHLPVNANSIQYGCLYGFTALENVNIPMGLNPDGNYPDHFLKNCPNLLEIYAPVEKQGTNDSFIDGNPNRNFVVAGAEMTFAQAAAYAASNASTYKWDADYTEESVTAAVLDKVVCSGMTSSWNDTLVYDEDNLILSGTFTLTNGTDSYSVALEVADDNFEIATEDLKSAFDAYVEANGNSILYADVLDGVKAELNKAGIPTPNGFISLAQKDFYIKHAVDGVIDEDPNPETRINIPGSDGAVSAVFTVGDVRVPLVKAIPHTVENLGVLAVTKNDVNENGELYAATLTETGKKHKMIVTEDVVSLNQDIKLYGGSVEDLVAIVMTGFGSTTITTTVGYSDTLNGVKALVMSDNITAISQNWAFSGLESLKYLHLSTGLTSISGGSFAGCTVLENVNFDDVKIEKFQWDSFKECPALYEVVGPTASTNSGSSLTGGPEGRNYIEYDAEMTFIQAAAYAQSNANDFEYELSMTADEIADKIIGGKINYSAGLTADWNDTYNFDAEALTVSGTLTVADSKGNTMDIDFFRDFGAEMDVPEMKYLEFDTTDTALAIKLDDIADVEEVGIEVSITTANGTNTYNYSTAYVNAAAKNNKAFIALAEKVYYCDVDMNGVIDGNDLITLTKNLLLDNKSNATADLKEDGLVNILDFIKLKKLMAAKELEFSSLAFTDYTYAFAISELASAEGVENVTIKPYCMISGLKFYGEESSLAQFSSDWTVLVKP